MSESMQQGLVTESAFNQLADAICTPSNQYDRALLSIEAESSDFVRFNHNQVRQATRVKQYEATLSLVDGARRVSSTISLGPDYQANLTMLKHELQRLGKDLPMVPDDPYLLLPDSVTSSSRNDTDQSATPTSQAADEIVAAGAGTDLVGFYAAGTGIVGFADSRGQRNWHRVDNFHFDWSLYIDVAGATDRAVKSAYAGRQWQAPELSRRMTQARAQLEPLARPARSLEPGKYRAYITPAAATELLGGLAWSGFSRKERDSGTSSLCLLAAASETMHSAIEMSEAAIDGIAPAFTNTGFIRPDVVRLITGGRAASCLVSPRSAAEFGEVANCDASEYPQSLAVAGGTLNPADALAALDTGIWIGNLWYLNYSDRPNCRMTGMTRFASFWVENGKLIAPIAPMRFDDSLIRMFGEGLIGLTSEPEFMPDSSTWGKRHLSSLTSPGLLVSDMAFTL